ncbi:helix-turn-helix domain-containing protein [Natrialba sp. PRR66]|uniref:helix-turn-helix domain-containing protein n=1 Tax=Natrialba sp. PRR66 TaxID=3098146 RepID=UPI002B1E124F|nr:helix-turn-helix domain-containing protein [Natrialba sp. PRR66]
MPITVKAYAEHDELALTPTLRSVDGIEIEVITQANTDPHSNVFPFLIKYDDRDELERHVESDPTVDSYELVDADDDVFIYYIEHPEGTILLSPIITEVNGFTLRTKTRRRGWFVQLQLPDREALNTIWEYAEECGMKLEIIEIHGSAGAKEDISFGLTDEQIEALQTAYECGYFNEPRDTALKGVADEVGVSSTAISGRLRRGMRNLVSAALIDEDID